MMRDPRADEGIGNVRRAKLPPIQTIHAVFTDSTLWIEQNRENAQNLQTEDQGERFQPFRAVPDIRRLLNVPILLHAGQAGVNAERQEIADSGIARIRTGLGKVIAQFSGRIPQRR
jgi:hypothetical protein